MMETLHPDAPAIDRIGLDAIRDHFEISRQAVFYWRRAGVPKQHRKTLAMLGEQRGLPMPEMTVPRSRELA
jgi:hypothetical protein